MKFSILSIPFLIVFLSVNTVSIKLLSQGASAVKIWEEDLSLPTYVVDPPEKSPMFFDNDSYQGASKVIYPYPLEDDITNRKITKTYKAVYIENEYLKVCVLPEIGGRLFYATDKTNGYEIFYRQNVIKPAHIGMLGAWISGGIEFCVFHHHRATTNMPVDYKLVQNEDGSATLWIGETELRHRMKWTFGISLYPGKSYLEVDGRMINSTENANSILYWANVATHVNDDYQIIFPPSTQFAVYHSKNSFSHWPITKEAYRGNTYYEGNIDASMWKNHPTSNSFFAHEIKEGFLAGYDYGQNAGTMVVGNPHIVKGAKLWEWGPGPRYAIWDTKVLTDNDGPYAELMSGAYSDNQPDYSWLKPYEIKTFKQYWYPIRETSGALSANLNGLLNLKTVSNEELFIAANTTAPFNNAKIVLTRNETILFEKDIDISPSKPFNQTINISNATDQNGLKLSLYNAQKELLLAYVPVRLDEDAPLPPEAKPPKAPKDIQSTEELYLTGLRIKQFHNARVNPVDYFEEALKRDPLDTRSNTQMGIIYKEKGNFEQAASYFRKALHRLTANYTRPRNCEPFYHLGIILKAQGKLEAAYDTLYRAAWDYTFASASYFQLAQISTQNKTYDQALIELERSLSYNANNLNALNLKATILRKMGQVNLAEEVVQQVLDRDQLNFWAYNEQVLLGGDKKESEKLKQLMRDQAESYLELSVAYLNAGLIEEAQQILLRATESEHQKLALYPTIHYYLGYIEHLMGDTQKAKAYFNQAKQQSIDYCFPFRLESVNVFHSALEYDKADAMAYYYLGNLLYDKQAEKAIGYWEQAVQHDPNLAMAYRNLGWGYYQTHKDLDKAIEAYEKAIAKDGTQARFYDELDRLYEEKGSPIEKRYQLLTENHQVVAEHTSPLIREALVSVGMADYDRAIEIMTTNYFNRREGSGGLHDLYVDALLLRGQKHLQEKKWKLALKDFEAADLYPENQSIGRDEKSQRRAQIFYFTGLANEKMKNKQEAKAYYQKACSIEVKKMEYNYHKAMAYRKLGEEEKAAALLKQIAEKGDQMLAQTAEVDFFSKFGGNNFENLRKARANYLLGLSRLGTNQTEASQAFFKKAIALHPGHAWAKQMLRP